MKATRTVNIPVPAMLTLSDRQIVSACQRYLVTLMEALRTAHISEETLVEDKARAESFDAESDEEFMARIFPTEFAKRHFTAEELEKNPFLGTLGFMADADPNVDYYDEYIQEKYGKYI